MNQLTAAVMAAIGDGPKVAARRKRVAQLKAHADRCATCDKPFSPADVIYRRGGFDTPVLPYCVEHACNQSDGYHNADVSDGYHYPNCRCPTDDRGRRKWLTPKPCECCGRRVANDRETADLWRFTRGWMRYDENESPRNHTFCSGNCRRRFYAAAKRAKRPEREPQPCDVCGERFAATRADAAYCSDACRQKAYRRRQLEDGGDR